MAGFRFKYEVVLNLKKRIEENAKNELGKAVSLLNEENEKLFSLRKKEEEYINAVNYEALNGTTIERLKVHVLYLGVLKNEIEKQKENVLKAEENVNKRRLELYEAVKQRKIFEKLREKKYKEYLLEMNKIEQKQIDELVSYKYTKSVDGE